MTLDTQKDVQLHAVCRPTNRAGRDPVSTHFFTEINKRTARINVSRQSQPSNGIVTTMMQQHQSKTYMSFGNFKEREVDKHNQYKRI